jgi:AraC family transcriptional regulator
METGLAAAMLDARLREAQNLHTVQSSPITGSQGFVGLRTVVFHTAVAGCELYDQRYSPGHETPWHCHQMAELCFLSSGSFTELAADCKLEYPQFGLGFKPAGLDHRVRIERPGARCLVVSVWPASLSEFGLEPGNFADPRVFDARDLAHLCFQAATELGRKDAAAELTVQGLLLELLGRVGRLPAETRPRRPPSWLPRIEERLREEWAKRPSLRSLALEAGVAPSVMVPAFRRFYGCTIGEFLRRLQVERACVLLVAESHSLAQIAATCGFYDQSHFTKLFARYIGTTPARFRQERTGRRTPAGQTR